MIECYLTHFQKPIAFKEFEKATKPGSRWVRATVRELVNKGWIHRIRTKYTLTSSGRAVLEMYLTGRRA